MIFLEKKVANAIDSLRLFVILYYYEYYKEDLWRIQPQIQT